MKQFYILALTFLFFTPSFAQQQAQYCNKLCTVERKVGEGVFLGVQITNCPKSTTGARVIRVVEGTQAEEMGIQKGDIIQSINGLQISDYKFLVKWVGEQKANLPVKVELLRNNKQQALKGRLGYKTEQMVSETICCDEQMGKLELNGVKAYPNPNNGSFTFSFEAPSKKPYNLRIVDMAGSTVFENTIYPNGKSVNEQIQFNAPYQGDYITIVEQDGKTFEQKLVVVK